jgi:hypothetical protein
MTLPQLPKDKANHFIYGLLIAAIGGSGTKPLIGLALCVWMGLLKEMFDRLDDKPTKPSFIDFLATLLGGLVYYSITLIA